MALQPNDVRMVVPRVRRALDPGVASASAASAYSDDMLLHISADAIAELILMGGGGFPYALEVASATVEGYPTEYITDPVMPIHVQQLVAIQAAIGQVWTELRGLRIKEKITNEGGSWEYEKSAALLRDKIKSLLEMRKAALDILALENPTVILDTFTSVLGVRASDIRDAVEPYDAGGA